TSDNPVVKLNYYGNGKYDLKGGWANEKGNIIFPLDPEHAMYVQIGERSFPRGARLSEEQTVGIRRFIAENAHRKIFSCSEDPEILNLRERLIDPERIRKEKGILKDWHERNAELELKYLKSNLINH